MAGSPVTACSKTPAAPGARHDLRAPTVLWRTVGYCTVTDRIPPVVVVTKPGIVAVMVLLPGATGWRPTPPVATVVGV